MNDMHVLERLAFKLDLGIRRCGSNSHSLAASAGRRLRRWISAEACALVRGRGLESFEWPERPAEFQAC